MGIGKLSNSWKVNDTPIYVPVTPCQVLHSSIASADSGRTEDGVMHNSWVRSDVVKVFMKWAALTGNEVKTLITLMQGKDFTLTYEEFGETHVADVYVAEVNYSIKSSALFASEGGLYVDISANAVEK